MVNQEAIQRIDDSTFQELAAIVENYNQELRDQEIKALREKLDKLNWLLGMKIKTLKVREASHDILKVKHNQVDRNCKSQVNNIDNQLKQMKSFQLENKKKHYKIKMHFRQSKEEFEFKEEKFVQEIEKMSVYINDLHLTMVRNRISNDQLIEESDEYESDDYEIDWNEYLYRKEEYESDTQFEDDDDEPANQFQYQRPLNYHHNMQREQSQAIAGESDDEEDYKSWSGESTHPEEIQCSELIQYDEEPVESFAELSESMPSNEFNQIANIDSKLDLCDMFEEDEQNYKSCQDADRTIENDFIEMIVDVPNHPDESQCANELVELVAEPVESESQTYSNEIKQDNKCDIDDKDLKEPISRDTLAIQISNQATDPANKDLLVTESTSPNKDEQEFSTSNTETRDKVLEQEKPTKPEILPLKFSLDPFVHGYVEKKCEKPKSKPKKPRQVKPKTKAKFLNLVSFGGY